jgi:hypothetical protein
MVEITVTIDDNLLPLLVFEENQAEKKIRNCSK